MITDTALFIIARNDEEWLEECIDTLLNRTIGYFDFLFVDNACTDNSADYSEYADYVITFTEEQSLVHALNAAYSFLLSYSQYSYFGIIHPDMKFPNPEWLVQLKHEMEIYPFIGRHCASMQLNLLTHNAPGAEGANLTRREVLQIVGLYDETYRGIGGYEDWDYHRRMTQYGFETWTSAKSKVWHHTMGTRGKLWTLEDQLANAEYYERKWGDTKQIVTVKELKECLSQSNS